MAAPIIGYLGTITSNGVNTGFVSNWEATLETTEKEIGPFIGDGGTIYTYTTGRKLTGKLEATIPIGKDAGQTLLISGAMNGVGINIILTTTNGYTVTIPSGSISGFSMSQTASDTVLVSFDFTSSAGFTIT